MVTKCLPVITNRLSNIRRVCYIGIEFQIAEVLVVVCEDVLNLENIGNNLIVSILLQELKC